MHYLHNFITHIICQMALYNKIVSLFLLALVALIPLQSSGQKIDTLSSDGLFQAARKAVFENTDYSTAKAYLYKALLISPDYADISIFLGRIYTWTKNYDSGRICFKQVLSKQPDYEDATIAYIDLEYLSDNYDKALDLCRTGLRNNPASEALMLREAKILNAQKKFDEADRSIRKLLIINEKNTEAIALSNSFKTANKKVDDINTPSTFSRIKDTISSDGLLIAAKNAAFDKNDYTLAKNYLYQALLISPDYADIKNFLGRIHTWTKNYDSARFYFSAVLKAKPDYEDASQGFIDMEYRNDNYDKSLSLCNEALIFHPESVALLIRKAKTLNAMRRYTEAEKAINKALILDKNNTAVRKISNRTKELSSKNTLALSYDYVTFDKQFDDPWHLVSFDYTRTTGMGSVTGRINYANRFKENGVQYEIEAYPRISKTLYSYVSGGYSDNVGVFPNWRAGFSLYANLPKSFEGELGFRYLKFSGDPTWFYTAYMGKYFKSWLFGGRTYITPSVYTNVVSASYNISARYYYGSADDFIGGNFGYGISPDDNYNSVQIDSKIRLVSYKTGLLFKKKISTFNVLSFDASWANQEYLPQTNGNQYQISIGCVHRF